jgi:hypothetical protein
MCTLIWLQSVSFEVDDCLCGKLSCGNTEKGVLMI